MILRRVSVIETKGTYNLIPLNTYVSITEYDDDREKWHIIIDIILTHMNVVKFSYMAETSWFAKAAK